MTDNHFLAAVDLYHLGVVVPDLSEAAARYTAVSGYQWTKTVEQPLTVTTPTGDHEAVLKIAFSLQAPYLELIEEAPGTLWTATPKAAAHHLGYWVDDLAGAATHLEQHGYRQEARLAGDTLSLFAYYLDPAGARVEIVDRAFFPDFPNLVKSMAA